MLLLSSLRTTSVCCLHGIYGISRQELAQAEVAPWIISFSSVKILNNGTIQIPARGSMTGLTFWEAHVGLRSLWQRAFEIKESRHLNFSSRMMRPRRASFSILRLPATLASPPSVSVDVELDVVVSESSAVTAFANKSTKARTTQRTSNQLQYQSGPATHCTACHNLS